MQLDYRRLQLVQFQHVEQLTRHPRRVPILYVTHRKMQIFAVKVEANNGAFHHVNGKIHRFNEVIISFGVAYGACFD